MFAQRRLVQGGSHSVFFRDLGRIPGGEQMHVRSSWIRGHVIGKPLKALCGCQVLMLL